MPLLLAGLGLLSINHEWAKKLLHTIKSKGSSLYEIAFPDNKVVHFLYDTAGLVLGGIAIYIISLETRRTTQTIAIAAVFICIGLLITNRRRLEKINKFISRYTRRNKT